jgi:hypothetical protein
MGNASATGSTRAVVRVAFHGHEGLVEDNLDAPITTNDTVEGTVGGVTLRHSAYTWWAMHRPVRTVAPHADPPRHGASRPAGIRRDVACLDDGPAGEPADEGRLTLNPVVSPSGSGSAVARTCDCRRHESATECR